MVTFTFDIAVKVVKHYQFLIGKGISGFDDMHPVEYIVIAPYYTDGHEEFWHYFIKEENNALALGLSKHNKDKLLIFLSTLSDTSTNSLREELDNNLTARGIEKIYNSDGTLKAP